MANFFYKGMDRVGASAEGTLEASNRSEVIAILYQRGLTPITIQEVPEGFLAGMKGSIEESAQKSSGPTLATPKELASMTVKSEELMLFTRQLSTMVEAGLPIDEAIYTLYLQTRNENFKKTLYTMYREIQGGKSISEAFARAPRIFSGIYTSMIKAAEASGRLGAILSQLADYMESSERIRQKVKSALTYPVIATCLVLIVASVLILVVVPKFEVIFEMVKGDLPLPTKIVLKVSRFATGNVGTTFLLFFGSVAAFIYWKRTFHGRRTLDTVKLKMPIFGTLFLQSAMTRFCRTFAVLIESGVPILQCLEIVEKTAGNILISEAVSEAAYSVRGGSKLGDVFEKNPVFPLMVTKIIQVGEKTGALGPLLLRMATFYDERVTAAVEGLTSMIEPLLIAFLGVVVGGIVVSIFLPMIKITQEIM